jgi:hypothetical protein
MATGLINKNIDPAGEAMAKAYGMPYTNGQVKPVATTTTNPVRTIQPVTAAPAATNTTATAAAPTPAVSTAPATTASPIPTAQPINPATSTINPATDTVQGQVEGIIKKGSPLMDLAETRAKQSANARGLLNSSMAVQAGEAAVLDAAVPIANADAGIYNRNKEVNQAADNTFRLQDKAAQTEFLMQNLRGEQATKLAEIENRNRELLQANQSATALYGQISATISNIMANPDMSANTKDQLINRELDLLNNGLAVTGGISNIPDLPNILKFQTPSGSNTLANVKVEAPTNPKPGQTYTDADGKKWKWISLDGKKGKWKPA